MGNCIAAHPEGEVDERSEVNTTVTKQDVDGDVLDTGDKHTPPTDSAFMDSFIDTAATPREFGVTDSRDGGTPHELRDADIMEASTRANMNMSAHSLPQAPTSPQLPPRPLLRPIANPLLVPAVQDGTPMFNDLPEAHGPPPPPECARRPAPCRENSLDSLDSHYNDKFTACLERHCTELSAEERVQGFEHWIDACEVDSSTP